MADNLTILVNETGLRGAPGADVGLAADLAANGGAAQVGTSSGDTVQEVLDDVVAGIEGALAGPAAYGALTPSATASTTLTDALTDQGRGGSLLINSSFSTGASAPANPGVDLYGEHAVYFNAADTQGNQVWNKVGRLMALGKFGREQLFVILNKIRTFATCKIALVGDSNTASYAGAELATILSGIPGATVTNWGVSGSTIDNWINDTGTVNGTGKDMAAVIADAPNLIIFMYGGTNEPYYGRTLSQYDTDLDSALTTIRASLSRRACSILLCSANTQNDGAGSRDELFVHQARWSQLRAAIEHGCAWFDKLALAPDASIDFGAGTNQNTWLDSNRVHTQNGHTTMIAGAIADFIIPKGFAARAVLGEHPVIPAAVKSAVFADGMTSYPAGGALTQRATTANGWPLDGFVTTIRSNEGTGGAVQELWSRTTGERYRRNWNGSAWTGFVADGISAKSGNAVLATAITSYVRGFSAQRAIPGDGWPLDGFIITYLEPVTGAYGYQEIQAYNSNVAPQRRQWVSGAWTAWTALW